MAVGRSARLPRELKSPTRKKRLSKSDIDLARQSEFVDDAFGVRVRRLLRLPDDNEVDRIEEKRVLRGVHRHHRRRGGREEQRRRHRRRRRTDDERHRVVGTGDTIAGVIAALLVQGLPGRDAAELGAWIAGKAGELATVERGNSIVTTDTIGTIPDTVQ